MPPALDDEWAVATPAEVGLDAARLSQLDTFLKARRDGLSVPLPDQNAWRRTGLRDADQEVNLTSR